MLKTILFDLDGTLLPMDNEEFTRYYFGFLCKKLAPHGYDAKELIDAIWSGTAAMVKNDGTRTNEEVFWNRFAAVLGERVYEARPIFEDFYANEFNNARDVCGFNPKLVALVQDLKARGIPLGLATNPIFPGFATENRIRWAGLEPADFAIFTAYESIGLSKPNPEYYREVLRRMDAKPEETLMVGNDVDEDMIAATLGMHVFLLTDCVINKKSKDISVFPHGNADDLKAHIENLLKA